MLYTFKNIAVENNNPVYNAGVTKLFLFTKGQTGGSKELKELLTYMEHSTSDNAVDIVCLELDCYVGKLEPGQDDLAYEMREITGNLRGCMD